MTWPRVLRETPPPPDPSITVQGQARLYACPDLAAVDEFLAELSDQIRRVSSFPKLQDQYRLDVDALLDRRLWLEMTT
jgi:hypothetical protein